MEERLGVAYPVGARDEKAVVQAKAAREKIGGKGKGKKGGNVNEREVEEAIRITEERLGMLKRAMQEGKREVKESSADTTGVGEESVGDGGGGVE